VLIETFLIDRSAELYGRPLTIEFLARLRGERRFDSVAALVDQMALDVEAAREVVARAAADAPC
jgi:riboflavin kinase/FMN adenylyltransferase